MAEKKQTKNRNAGPQELRALLGKSAQSLPKFVVFQMLLRIVPPLILAPCYDPVMKKPVQLNKYTIAH